MDMEVRIGYYNTGGASRPCDAMNPENLPAGALTHVNVAFEYIGSDHRITDEIGDMTARVSRLKKRHPGLRVSIAIGLSLINPSRSICLAGFPADSFIGGWVFNDPPTQRRFTEMASTKKNRAIFIGSVTGYMRKYGLDGLDIGTYCPCSINFFAA